jgi:acyl-CoA synthetase (AMP-forming)/AMP-acid ligase II
MMIQGRDLAVGYTIAKYLRLKPSDRMYTCMPLYHGAAHGLAVTPIINAGATLVLGRKFSHSKFWPEVRKSKANIIQYVGELCRYLVNAPPHPLDRDNNVEMAWGNGMRPDVWQKFRDRFGIETINELYAATDGLGTSFIDSKNEFTRNAVGKRGLIWKLLKGKLEIPVKIDVDTEDILRDENGFAIKCAKNEPGEIIHKLDPTAPDSQFHGYWKNREAGEKRKIKDVFKKGDLYVLPLCSLFLLFGVRANERNRWFRSGDMLRLDTDGRLYFVDRLGDTFRWKSENVSTNEVSDVLGAHPHIAEANVYGVTVPNADGRCGMAAIVMPEHITLDKFDFRSVAKHVLDALPRYAIPHFLRITPQLDYTGTLKIQKGRLKREGIDVDAIEQTGDKLYWLADGAEEYVPFTKEHHGALKEGKARL